MQFINRDKESNNNVGITSNPSSISSAFVPYSSSIKKCDYFLPDYIQYDQESGCYEYRNDKSSDGGWIKTKSLRQAEIRSGFIKKQWTECPLFMDDINKKGYKYVPRNDVNLMKKYINEFYPGSINLNDGETINDVKKIWVYDSGYYSYKLEQKRKNLERNCTDGMACKDRNNGLCSYNHYVERGKSLRMCPSDVNSQYSKCNKCICSYDHSINRKAIVENYKLSLKNNILRESFNSFDSIVKFKIKNSVINDDDEDDEDDEEITSFSESSLSDVTDITYQYDETNIYEEDNTDTIASSFYIKQPFEKSNSEDCNIYFNRSKGLCSGSPDFMRC